MILKYAYAYSNPNGTFYIGYKEGVVTHTLSANVLNSIAAREGTTLSHLRRLAAEKLGHDDFELLNVTPSRITERGIISGEEIKELYELVKFNEDLQVAVGQAILANEAKRKKSIDYVGHTREYLSRFLSKEIKIDVKVNGNRIDVALEIPLKYIVIELELEGVKDGSNGRT